MYILPSLVRDTDVKERYVSRRVLKHFIVV